ncbi:MAG: efflux RND transporter periplasmic adaptor subunit [Gammaproteobacteria bacterium]|nr:efflux RND transporter periplasmic adaptor subunit [Gammaproteobacteria bacterium]
MMILKNKKLIPVAIFGVLIAIAMLIRMNPPETPQRPAFSGPSMTVETTPVLPRDYQIMLQSYGTVQPRTRSMLVAQVGGQIVEINENVRDGGFFEKGDVLGRIDPRDYEADVQISQASLADAKQALAEAIARSEQAREDWERLGNEGEPSDLVLRIPQLEAARARVDSAESALTKAKLDLERTSIVAPFAGRVIRKLVDIGQVVGPNAQLAEIYATDVIEIRLPLRNRDLGFIDLPESYRYVDADDAAGIDAIIKSDLIGEEEWQAKLVRTEGTIDESARQLHVIAQILDPFGPQSEGRSPLKIGQYVTAEIEGRMLPGVLVIPNNTIYQGTYVYTVEDGILRRRDIEIAWQNDFEAVVRSGLEPGVDLVTTPLGQVTSGIRVTVMGAESRGGRRNGPPGDQPPGAAATRANNAGGTQ